MIFRSFKFFAIASIAFLSTSIKPSAQSATRESTEIVKLVSPEEAAAALEADPKIIVIDVRTPEEYAQGHIAKALNIDVKGKDFSEKISLLERSKTYLVHCRSGVRSAASMKTLKELGFENILHLDSGLKGWIKAGFSKVTPQ